jgi:hypothetical protein
MGVLECWSIGVLECWSIGKTKLRKTVLLCSIHLIILAIYPANDYNVIQLNTQEVLYEHSLIGKNPG